LDTPDVDNEVLKVSAGELWTTHMNTFRWPWPFRDQVRRALFVYFALTNSSRLGQICKAFRRLNLIIFFLAFFLNRCPVQPTRSWWSEFLLDDQSP